MSRPIWQFTSPQSLPSSRTRGTSTTGPNPRWLREEDLQESMKNTQLIKGTKRAPPKTEIVQEERPGARVDQVIVNQAPETVAREASTEEEKVHKTEAEEVQSHQLVGEASQKNLNA